MSMEFCKSPFNKNALTWKAGHQLETTPRAVQHTDTQRKKTNQNPHTSPTSPRRREETTLGRCSELFLGTLLKDV